MKKESNIRNSKRAVPRICALAVGLVLVTSLPAAASWQQQVVKGVPGAVVPVDLIGAEGGVCGDIAALQWEPANCKTESQGNQMYIDRFRVYTANYSAYQTIKVTESLYFWNSNQQWTFWLSRNLTSVSGIKPYSNLSVIFGNPASDMPNAPNCPVACTPAFAALPRGVYVTVVVTVSWVDSSTGNVLAIANYTPTISTYDIGCANYAKSINRCWTYSQPATSRGLPTNQPSVGFIAFP